MVWSAHSCGGLHQDFHIQAGGVPDPWATLTVGAPWEASSCDTGRPATARSEVVSHWLFSYLSWLTTTLPVPNRRELLFWSDRLSRSNLGCGGKNKILETGMYSRKTLKTGPRMSTVWEITTKCSNHLEYQRKILVDERYQGTIQWTLYHSVASRKKRLLEALFLHHTIHEDYCPLLCRGRWQVHSCVLGECCSRKPTVQSMLQHWM